MSVKFAKTDIIGFSGQNFGTYNSASQNCLKATGTPKQNAPVRAFIEKCGTVRGQIKSPLIENALGRRRQILPPPPPPPHATGNYTHYLTNRVNQLTATLAVLAAIPIERLRKEETITALHFSSFVATSRIQTIVSSVRSLKTVLAYIPSLCDSCAELV